MSTVLYLLAAPAMATLAGLLMALYAMYADKPPTKPDQPATGPDHHSQGKSGSALAE